MVAVDVNEIKSASCDLLNDVLYSASQYDSFAVSEVRFSKRFIIYGFKVFTRDIERFVPVRQMRLWIDQVIFLDKIAPFNTNGTLFATRPSCVREERAPKLSANREMDKAGPSRLRKRCS